MFLLFLAAVGLHVWENFLSFEIVPARQLFRAPGWGDRGAGMNDAPSSRARDPNNGLVGREPEEVEDVAEVRGSQPYALNILSACVAVVSSFTSSRTAFSDASYIMDVLGRCTLCLVRQQSGTWSPSQRSLEHVIFLPSPFVIFLYCTVIGCPYTPSISICMSGVDDVQWVLLGGTPLLHICDHTKCICVSILCIFSI